MLPSNKSAGIEAFIENVFQVDRRATIEANRCVSTPIGCGQPIKGFRDTLSRDEYKISGLCQNCQDNIFGLA